MLTLIGGNWLKPEVSEGTSAIIAFNIQRDGRVTDVKLISPSGVGVYDRAAIRAVYAANPLPPLPPEFTGERLGVHLRFR
jgi:TonB family protein